MKFSLLPLLLGGLLCLLPALSQAQADTLARPKSDSVSTPAIARSTQDSVPVATEKKKFLPVPRKALMWSIIPGAGQIYNRRYWKAPLVYGALGGMVILINHNQRELRRFKTALKLKLAEQPHEFTGTRYDDANALRRIRDAADKNTQLSYIGTVILYALQGVEAYTDAHLMNFDISESLSLQVKPHFGVNPTSLMPAPGLGVRLGFSK